MFKNKYKNQKGGIVLKRKFRISKKIGIIIFIAIFVIAAGALFFNKFSHPQKQAATKSEQESEIAAWWLKQYFSVSVCNQDICQVNADPDKDGLTNKQEYFYHTDPLKAFTVGDKLNDGQLVAAGFDPSKSGHITFDEVPSEDNLIGESLVFDSSIKEILNEMSDPTKIKLPEIKSEELTIINDNSKQAKIEYSRKVDEAVKQYFSFDVEEAIKRAQQEADIDQLSEIKILSVKLLAALKSIPVPSDYVQLHKYYIALAELTPKVIYLPGETLSSSDDDIWYDNAQTYMVLLQKIALEKQKIKNINETGK